MTIHRREQQILTLRELSLEELPIPKATTIGVVVDCTSTYHDSVRNLYSVKLHLIDPTYNAEFFTPYDKSTYLTVFIQNDLNQSLPHPRAIGDILYLKRYTRILCRFKFTRYSGQFQAFNHHSSYCSWTLFDGNASSQYLQPYETSKNNLHFKEDQQLNLRLKVRQLRGFTYNFLQKASVLSLHPSGFITKDSDIIVKVLKKSMEDGYLLTDGKKELLLAYFTSQVKEGDIAKLRSVVRVDKHDKIDQIIANQYTSLLALPEHSFDVHYFYKRFQIWQKIPQMQIYTSLRDIQGYSSSDCLGRHFNVKVQISSVFPQLFQQILKYYHKESNTLLDDKPSPEATDRFGYFSPVYLVGLICSDYKDLDFMTELFIFSNDGKCKDLVPHVNLDEDLTQFSNLVDQNYFYSWKREELLNAEYVCLVVEPLFDSRADQKILRVVKIGQIY